MKHSKLVKLCFTMTIWGWKACFAGKTLDEALQITLEKLNEILKAASE